MKTIGLLGGMSWESSILYYQTINRAVRDAHPEDGLTSAPIILDSVNFAQVARWQREGNWAAAAEFLIGRAQSLEAAGAKVLGICTNTMHKLFDEIAASVGIPMIHITTPTIAALQTAGIKKILLLGTRFSMQETFLRDAYAAQGIEMTVPDAADQDIIHNIIMRELCQGVATNASRQKYVHIIEAAQEKGVQAVVLGCTEITLLIGADDCALPVFDTADLHARALSAFCLD